MKKISYFITLFLLVIFSAVAWAGSLTSNNFIYKPAQGARGATEKSLFDAGLDRIDARLGKEIWVGDPLHLSLDAILADSTVTSGTIVVPAGTHTLSSSSSRTLAAGLTLRVLQGGIISIPTLRTLIINGSLEAGLKQIFSGAGSVVFGAGAVKEVYPEWWGALGDNSTECGPALVAAFTAYPKVKLTNGVYKWSYASANVVWLNGASSHLTYCLQGVGKSTRINLSGWNSTSYYAIRVNDNGAGGYVTTPRHPRLVVRDVQIEGTNSTSNPQFCQISQCSAQFINVCFIDMFIGLNAINYCDNILFDGVYWAPAINNGAGSWALKTNGSGDSLMVRQFFAGDTDAIYLTNCQGGELISCNGGRYKFDRCQGVTVKNGHFEWGSTTKQFIIKNSTVALRDNVIFNTSVYEPVYIDDDPSVVSSSQVTLENNVFMRQVANSSGRMSEVFLNALNDNSRIRFKNNKVYAYIGGAIYQYDELGLWVYATPTAIKNRLAADYPLLFDDATFCWDQADWRIYGPQGPIVSIKALAKPATPTIALTTDVTGTLTPGTYYYVLVYETWGQKTAPVSDEFSAVVASLGQSVKITLTGQPAGKLYIYRSTSSGAPYTKQFVIPCNNSGTINLYDTGSQISTYAANTGSYTPSASNYTVTGFWNLLTRARIIYDTAAPTVGSWLVGDICTNSAPAVGQPKGWRCTVAGSPGTWVSEGNL